MIGVDEKRAHGIVAERGIEHEIELRARDRVRHRRETIEVVQRLGDFRSAAMPVAHLSLKPARVGGASTKGARDLLRKGTDLRRAGDGRVEVIERRVRSRFYRRGGEPPFMLGESVGVERVLAGQVLRVNEGLGASDLGLELSRRFARLALAIVGVAGRGEISLRQLRPLSPFASRNARAEPDAIAARRRAKYSRQALARKTGKRIVLGALLERGDGANRGREERDLTRKDVAKQTGNAQRHVDPRAAQHGERQHLEAADAGRRRVPNGPAADQRKCLREIVAAAAQGSRAPQVEDHPLRPFAMVLRVTRANLFGRAPAALPGGAGGGRSRIDGVKIAAGRQDVETAARWRASRSWRHELSAERAQEAEGLSSA